MGSAVLLSSLWIMSTSHHALKVFLENTFTNQISQDNSTWLTIAVFMSLSTILGCINTGLTIRNGKGIQVWKPKLWLQFLMCITLGFPKLILISFALCYAPYLYVGLMVLEYALILCHQKVFFNAFNGKCSKGFVTNRLGATLTDLGALLTQDVLLGPDQRLLKPFFDILKNRGEGTSQSYYIEAVYLLTLRGPLAAVFQNIKKWF